MNRFLDKLSAIYGPPSHVDDVAAYFEDVAGLMRDSGYTDDEQTRAANLVIRNHKGKSWPDIPTMLKACGDARELARPAPQQRLHTADQSWTQERLIRADELCRSALGEQADREGWLLGLHEFCRMHGRIPSVAEIRQIKETSEFIVRCAAGHVDMGLIDHQSHGGLGRIANNILDRRKSLGDRIFGEK